MNEEKAEALAALLGGAAWNSGGNVWLVLLDTPTGRRVAISDEVVCEYENEDALESGAVLSSIRLGQGEARTSHA